MKTFNGKTIWITGASSGIGKALAVALSPLDCKLILSARRAEKLEETRKACAYPEDVEILPLDLAKHANMESLANKAISKFGTVDVLVNNAGISQRSLIAETDFSVYKTMMDINYLGTVALTKALLPHFMTQNSGHFVTVTSLMGKFGSPYRSGYCGAKHALHGFFDVLRMEHETNNIDVTMVCPGFVQTAVAKNALTADGTPQNENDTATQNGLPADVVAQKIIKAIQAKRFEVYIGQKEVQGIYLKRFFPKLLHKVVLKSQVR
ncbi:MAG: SDR family oxidoreductase [Bacteroidota bacterium]